MGVFESIVGFFLNLAWVIIQIAFSLATLAVVYFAVWLVISMFWEIIHEPSYKWFVKKVKSIWKKLIDKFGKFK